VRGEGVSSIDLDVVSILAIPELNKQPFICLILNVFVAFLAFATASGADLFHDIGIVIKQKILKFVYYVVNLCLETFDVVYLNAFELSVF
jgi:hypothetical protein